MESWVNNSPVEGITLNREESEVVVSMVNVTGLTPSDDKFSWEKNEYLDNKGRNT